MITDDVTAATPFADLLAEVQEKNHVRVEVYRAVRGPAGLRHRRVLDELAKVTAYAPAMYLADSVRVLRGLKPMYAAEWRRRLGLHGALVGVNPNLRTNVGIDYTANALGSTSQPSQADYIALSNNTAATNATDTSSTTPWSTTQATDIAAGGTTGEWTGLGLTRKQATYAHTTSVASYTMAATWTATGTATATSKAGLFGGAAKTAQGTGATNILYLANTFTATTLATADQLSLTWTVTC